MHSRPFAVVSPSGDLNWFNWWDLPDNLLSFGHVLSRGASWFFWNSDQSTRQNMGVRAWNQMSFSYAKYFRCRLRQAGWLVRKEDRGKRLVLFPVSLANAWFAEEAERRGFVPAPLVPGASPVRIYFLPKTHKPGPLRGRLVEACGARAKPLKLPRAEWSVNDVSQGVSHFELPQGQVPLHRFSGDIEKMYPSIPLPELSLLLAQRGAPQAAELVSRVFRDYRLSFGSQSFAVPVGLPIGHPWSPALADFYLSVKEEPFVAKLHPSVKFRRYADDTFFQIPCASPVDHDAVRHDYEQAVAPLHVEWEFCPTSRSTVKFLDARFASRSLRQSDPHLCLRQAPSLSMHMTPHLGPFQPPGGTLPSSFVVSSILGRSLRVAEILCRSEVPLGSGSRVELGRGVLPGAVPTRRRSKWESALLLLQGDLPGPHAAQFLDQLTDGNHAVYVKGAINICIRHLENVPNRSELPVLRLAFCPYWLSASGKRHLSRIGKVRRIRWDLVGIRRLQHIV